MMKAETLHEIDRLLVAGAVHVLGLSSAAVFRQDNGLFRRSDATSEWASCALRELRPDEHEFALRSITKACPIRLSRIDCERNGLPTGLAAPCLAVPAQTRNRETIAVVLYGPHRTGTDIDADECEMLVVLAERAATTYEHVHTMLLQREVALLRAQLAALRTA
jgi:hypothetical protein